MMRNTTATKSSTPLMTITSPTPFRQGRPLTGKRELELRAQHPSGTPDWDSLSDWRQRLASPSGADQVEKPPAGELSSLSPSGSRGGPAGASAPASMSSTSGGGEELKGLGGGGRRPSWRWGKPWYAGRRGGRRRRRRRGRGRGRRRRRRGRRR